MNRPPPPDNAPPGETSSFDGDDAVWFDRLAGRITTAHAAETLAEADALRRVVKHSAEAQIQSDPDLQAALSPTQTEARLQALLTQLREQDALSAPPWWRRWHVPVAGAALAAAMLGALLIPRLMSDPVYYDEPPTMRGAVPAQSRQAADPKAAAEALAQRLKVAGLAANVYQRGRVFTVDIYVPAEVLPEAAAALQADGLAPQAGQVRVEVSAP